MIMAKLHGEMTCAIWAFIRDSGGYWSAREIAEQFVLRKDKAERYLRKLFERSHLARIEDVPASQGGRELYGYVHRCIPLPGQSAEPLEN